MTDMTERYTDRAKHDRQTKKQPPQNKNHLGQ